jgi:multidrug efflux pump subunit AcrA (membrane-fusion protein)
VTEPKPRRQIFRAAALDAHRRGDRPGRPLEAVSRWTRLAELVIVAVIVAGTIFAATVRVGEYAEGVAVVRREGRVLVTSAVAGTVQRIEVEPGRRVAAGAVLVRLDDSGERAEYERAKQGYERRLVELLRNPGDPAKRERLAGFDAALQLAEAKLRERTIVAPEAGVVSDVRVRPGQPVMLGDAVISLEQDTARTVVVGLFPGHYRPLLSGADVRLYLELEGFPGSRQAVAIRSVADEVVGPAEAMRYLGRDRQGTLELSGPVVLVETELPSDLFTADDVEYRVFDGMQGTLEAKLRSATLLETFIETLLPRSNRGPR